MKYKDVYKVKHFIQNNFFVGEFFFIWITIEYALKFPHFFIQTNSFPFYLLTFL